MPRFVLTIIEILLICDKENKYFISMKAQKNVNTTVGRCVLFYFSTLMKNMSTSNKYNTFKIRLFDSGAVVRTP